MQATVRMALVNQFKHKIEKGKVVTLQRYSLGEIQPKARCVQNGYHGTKLFAFDRSVPIVKEELFAKHDIEKSENMSTRISKASKNSTKESFIFKIPPRIIAELLDVAQAPNNLCLMVSNLLLWGTIIVIHKEEGWWYIGCKGYKKKVIRSSDIVDMEAGVPKKTSSGKDDWWSTKCNIVPNIKTM
ncbi:hypothetical protein Tco_0696589 [Tanacetum coccineum]